jgi:outer membrane protein TolC
LEGFSGVGGGGFGRVGGFEGRFGGQGFGFTGGAGAQQAGGYIGLLQQAQVIQNQYANIGGLGDSLAQLQAAYDAGRIDRFQVDLARQALYNAQSQLLNSEALYESALDIFKLQHGMPPSLKIKIADPMLEHFTLLDSDLAALQIRVTDVLTVLREGPQAADAEGRRGEELALPVLPPPDTEMKTAATDFASLVRESVELNESSKQRFAATLDDLQRLGEVLPSRRAELERLSQREETKELELDPDLLSPDKLKERVATLRTELETLRQRMAAAWAQLDVLTGDPPLTPEQHRVALTSALTDLSGALLELSLLQARARLDAITFDPVDLTPEEGYCIASRHRRDWMNARASLVDSWRLIHFNANDLESDLDLVFQGDIGNVSDNPFDLRATNGRLRVGLQFDAPLTRLAERNVYRQSLIEYQQARRQYYQFRDRVQRDVRATLRQLRLDELNFELRRAAVHVAITQVDLARLRLSEPARPVAASTPGTPTQPGGQAQFSSTVARDLVNALIDLLNVQNDFLSVWVDHDVQRLNLDYDLGIMELDSRGVRIEHNQSLKSFVNWAPFPPPCECPNACAPVQRGEIQQLDVAPTEEDLPVPNPLDAAAPIGPARPSPGAPALLPPPTN